MGSEVTLIDPGAEVAKYLKKKLGDDMLHEKSPDGAEYSYYVSDDVRNFEELGGVFLEREIIGQVQKIDIEKY